MQGFVAEAKVLVETCVAERARILGPNSKDTLSAESMLAIVLVDQGKYEAAEEMNRRALAGSEKVLGEEHPDTLTSVSNLAFLLEEMDDFAAAIRMYQRAHVGYVKTRGSSHPTTMRCYDHMSRLQQRLSSSRTRLDTAIADERAGRLDRGMSSQPRHNDSNRSSQKWWRNLIKKARR